MLLFDSLLFDIFIIALLFFYTRNFSKKSVDFVGDEFFTGFYNLVLRCDEVLQVAYSF